MRVSNSLESIVQDSQPSNPTSQPTSNDERVELPDVDKVRNFFDSKTKYHRSDKLSQAYITLKFTEDDATSCNLSLGSLRLMFQAYCENPEFTPTQRYPKGNWWAFWDSNIREEWNTLNDHKVKSIVWLYGVSSIKKIATFGLAITVIATVSGLSGAERQKYFQAWQVINTANTQSGNGGRNEALEYLKQDKLGWDLFAPKCQKDKSCLVGVKIEQANLNKVNLEEADLTSSEFRETSFRQAKLNKAILNYSNLNGANFEDAELKDVQFDKVSLIKKLSKEGYPMYVKFNNAHLENASFEEARLNGVKFTNAKLTDVSFKDAELTDVDFKGTGIESKDIGTAKYLCNVIISNGDKINRNCQTKK